MRLGPHSVAEMDSYVFGSSKWKSEGVVVVRQDEFSLRVCYYDYVAVENNSLDCVQGLRPLPRFGFGDWVVI